MLKLMRINNSVKNSYYKKGRSFLLLPFFLLAISCADKDLSRYGKISLHNTADHNSFVFSVSEEFSEKYKNSPKDKNNPKLSEAETKLLYVLLKQKQYCLNNGDPLFSITSRQEKVFDMTFAHLIEQNYKARPIVPRMYYGRCKSE